jgi:hypothetical protein
MAGAGSLADLLHAAAVAGRADSPLGDRAVPTGEAARTHTATVTVDSSLSGGGGGTGRRALASAATSGYSAAYPQRKRHRLSAVETEAFERIFQTKPHPGRDVIVALSARYGVPLYTVRIWYQNRRQRQRRLERDEAEEKRLQRPEEAAAALRTLRTMESPLTSTTATVRNPSFSPPLSSSTPPTSDEGAPHASVLAAPTPVPVAALPPAVLVSSIYPSTTNSSNLTHDAPAGPGMPWGGRSGTVPFTYTYSFLAGGPAAAAAAAETPGAWIAAPRPRAAKDGPSHNSTSDNYNNSKYYSNNSYNNHAFLPWPGRGPPSDATSPLFVYGPPGPSVATPGGWPVFVRPPSSLFYPLSATGGPPPTSTPADRPTPPPS